MDCLLWFSVWITSGDIPMSRNRIQFQPGLSLPEFLKNYGAEEQCRTALFNLRWPAGFSCPSAVMAVPVN
jgi:hypothetical protein